MITFETKNGIFRVFNLSQELKGYPAINSDDKHYLVWCEKDKKFVVLEEGEVRNFIKNTMGV